jgi:hypothetical protein
MPQGTEELATHGPYVIKDELVSGETKWVAKYGTSEENCPTMSWSFDLDH